MASQKVLRTTNGNNNPKNCMGIIHLVLKNKKVLINSEKIKTTAPKKTDISRNIQKKVEYIIESSFLSFLFSTISFTTKLFIPKVAIDLNIEVKFLKLPNNAIPEVPKKTETILLENMPKKKLIITEIEFSDKIFIKLFCFKIFNIIVF